MEDLKSFVGLITFEYFCWDKLLTGKATFWIAWDTLSWLMIIFSVSKFLLSWIVFVPSIYFRPASFLKAVTRSVLKIFYNFHLFLACASVLLKYLLNLTTFAYMLLILVYIFYHYVFVVEQLFSIKLVNFLNFLYYSIFFVTYLGHTFLLRVGCSDFALALTWVVGRYSAILQHSVTLY